MSLEEFALAAAPQEMRDTIKGKRPEMTIQGITLDTASYQTFRENLGAVAARVEEEKTAFQKAKKWATEQHRDGEADARMRAQLEEKKREMRGKFLPELTITLLFLVAWYFILDKVIVPMGSDPMELFKHVDSTWLIVWYALGSIVWLVTIFRGLISSHFKNIGRWIRLVFCVLLVGISVVAFTVNYPMHAGNTYQIDTAEELLAAKNFPRGTSFKLTADIDMEGEEISYLFDEFHGNFWGNGYTISNIELKKSEETGLFRENYGTIDSVKVSGLTINWTSGGIYYLPEFQLAALVTENYGTVKGSCSLENVKYDYYNDNKVQKFDKSFTPDFDVCRGHFVAFNAGTVETESFTTSNLSSADSWLSIWSNYVGHTDMMYAKNPTE